MQRKKKKRGNRDKIGTKKIYQNDLVEIGIKKAKMFKVQTQNNKVQVVR